MVPVWIFRQAQLLILAAVLLTRIKYGVKTSNLRGEKSFIGEQDHIDALDKLSRSRTWGTWYNRFIMPADLVTIFSLYEVIRHPGAIEHLKHLPSKGFFGYYGIMYLRIIRRIYLALSRYDGEDGQEFWKEHLRIIEKKLQC
ncbi:hypothetical protein ACFL34_06060 [Candidatus Sumerlaeota bacterium]